MRKGNKAIASRICLILFLLLCLSQSKAQIPSLYLSGSSDSTFLYNFSQEACIKSYFKKLKNNTQLNSNHYPKVVVSNAKNEVSFYVERNSVYNANGILIFTFDSLPEVNATGPYGYMKGNGFYIIYDVNSPNNTFLIRFNYKAKLIESILLTEGMNQTMSKTSVSYQSISGVSVANLTGTNGVKNKQYWLLGNSKDSLYVFEILDGGLSIRKRLQSFKSEFTQSQLYTDIEFSNKGDRIALGSVSLVHFPLGGFKIGDSTFIELYSFDKSNGDIAKLKTLKKFVGFSQNNHMMVQSSSMSYKSTTAKFDDVIPLRYTIGKHIVGLTFSPSDSILFCFSSGFGVSANQDDMRTDPFRKDLDIIAINLNSNDMLVRTYTNDFTGLFANISSQLMANGQLWISGSGTHYIRFPDKVFESNTIDLVCYDKVKEGSEEGNHYRSSAFVDGLFRYHKLEISVVQNCGPPYMFKVNFDTSFFDSVLVNFGDTFHIVNSTDTLLSYGDNHSLNEVNTELFGYAINQFVQSKFQSLSIPDSIQKPDISLKVEKFEGCQWNKLMFECSLSKTFAYDSVLCRLFIPNVSDTTFALGKDQIVNYETKFEASGTFESALISNTSTCIDTTRSESLISILPAPDPEILAVQSDYCTPQILKFRVRRDSTIESIHWSLNKTRISENIFDSINLTENQKVNNLKVEIRSSNGCLTTDSVQFISRPGVDSTTHPKIQFVTIEQDSVILHLSKSLNLNKIFLNGSEEGQTRKTRFAAKAVEGQNCFQVYAIDSCGRLSGASSIVCAIYLSLTLDSMSSTYTLTWTPYRDDSIGYVKYNLFTTCTGPVKEKIYDSEIDSALSMDFNNLIYLNYSQCCYEIKGFPDHNGFTTVSNTICINFPPNVYLPNAFSPNSDRINDIYSPITTGIDSFNIYVYSRWGELIYSGKEWDGTEQDNTIPGAGVYLVLFEGFTANGMLISRKILVQLVE